MLAAADFFTTDPIDGFLTGKKHLIFDRDSKFALAFRDLLRMSA